MKKKINDLTISEIKRICDNTHGCSSCSLFNTGTNIACLMDIPIALPSAYLEREVEIPNEPVRNSDKLEEEDEQKI